MDAIGGSCDPFFEDSVSTAAGELKVYRCDWGWYVRSGSRDARSRYLDDAFERVLGERLNYPTMRALVETLDRELTAEREKTGKTASRVLSPQASSAAQTRRCSVAQRVSSCRDDSCSFRNTFDTGLSTVFTERCSRAAISLYM